MLTDDPNVSQKGKQVCVDAVHRVREHTEEINGRLYRMESDRSLGYAVYYQDRMAITVSITQRTDHGLTLMNKAAYDGDGATCLNIEKQLIILMDNIYKDNIAYRRITK